MEIQYSLFDLFLENYYMIIRLTDEDAFVYLEKGHVLF